MFTQIENKTKYETNYKTLLLKMKAKITWNIKPTNEQKKL